MYKALSYAGTEEQSGEQKTCDHTRSDMSHYAEHGHVVLGQAGKQPSPRGIQKVLWRRWCWILGETKSKEDGGSVGRRSL